jgi:HAE1 family hydrophobic/amphiphilic exporter-1
VNPSALFIRLPVMTTLVMLGVLAFGIMGYRQLPISDLPSVDFPTIQVSASLPGASPETMAAAVATPLERQFSTIAGIDSMTSSSYLGNTQVTLQFALERSIDAAAQDVQTAIAAAQRQLPPGMPTPPTYRKVNPADAPILYLGLYSDTLPLSTVDEFGEGQLAQQISMINGVAQVNVYGSQKYAVRVQIDPAALASRGIAIGDVHQAIAQGNVNEPTGTLYGHHQAFTLQANGQLQDAAAFRQLIVAYRNGAPVRLGQVANVIDSVQNDKVANWFNGTRAVVLAVQRQPGTNTVAVVDAIKALLPRFRAGLPASLRLEELYDRSQSIRSSVSDVKHTLLLTAVLVVLVIFAFLRNARATIIPALSLPMSVIGTFAAMRLLGYNIDNLSLMALTLATGFVVDDAIVVLENIVRHTEQGEAPREAAFNGSRQIAFTVLSMTLSLAAVFIPLLFMGGLVGRLFREFAVTIAVAILISGFISLTLTPMLCSRFLPPHRADERHNAIYRASERVFAAMLWCYDHSLTFALRHRGGRLATIGVALLTIAATALIFQAMPKGFIPNEDTGQLVARTLGAQDVSFEAMARNQRALGDIIGKNPNIAAYMTVAGSQGSTNQGFAFMRLKDRGERKDTPEQVIDQLRKASSSVPGVRAFFQNPPPINIGGRTGTGQYQYTLQGTDLPELYRAEAAMEEKIRAIHGVTDVASDLQLSSPRVRVDVDRDKASALGLTADAIEGALADAFGANQVSTIYTDTDEYWVVLEADPRYQLDPAALSLIYLRPTAGAQASAPASSQPPAAGGLIPIGAVAKLSRAAGPLTINHQGQLPAVTISFNLAQGAAIGDVVAAIDASARTELPATVTATFQGSAQAFQSSLKGMLALTFIAIGVIYLILGILYESFIHPITILSGLPSAGIGALATLWIFGVDLNIYAFVGIIMLIGIVKKNAIMMIDFALHIQQAEGLSAAEAIRQGCLVRFRPIMMTTMAALMGTLPLAIGMGTVSNSRHALGLAVVGGLVFSQLITLYITPVVYIYLDAFQGWFGRLSSRQSDQTPAPARA